MDNRDSTEPEGSQSEFEKFEDFARKVVAVPKNEVDEQEKKYQAERKKTKKKPTVTHKRKKAVWKKK